MTMADRITIPGQSSANAIPSRLDALSVSGRHERMLFPHAFPDCHLHLFERADLDLPDPFPRHIELSGQVFKCAGLIGETARLEDATFPVAEDANCARQRVMALIGLVMRDDDGLRRGCLIDQGVLPFPGIPLLI